MLIVFTSKTHILIVWLSNTPAAIAGIPYVIGNISTITDSILVVYIMAVYIYVKL